MAREIHHRSYWGNTNPEGYGEVYYDNSATNKLYRHSDYYENSWDTDKTLRDLNNKASIVLTPTAYSDGSLNTVIPPYQVLPTELVTNGDFSNGTTNWTPNTNATLSIDNGRLKVAISGGSGYPSQNITTVVGKKYKITADAFIGTATKVSLYSAAFGFNDLTADGSYNLIFTATSTSTQIRLYVYGDGTFGFWDNVSVVKVTNDTDLPRIDYSPYSGAGTCGHLLLEPQRTNEIIHSNGFDDSSWQKTGVNVTANAGISPDGTNNAYLIEAQSSTSNHRTRVTGAPNNTVSVSIFAKKGTTDYAYFFCGGGSKHFAAIFDLSDGSVTDTNIQASGTILTSTSSISLGNGWYRLQVSGSFTTPPANRIGIVPYYQSTIVGTPDTGWLGNGESIYIYGAMEENGAYVSSYVPTESSTVTRSADVANNSGNADLFNDSEGVLYAEVKRFDNDTDFLTIGFTDGTNDNQVSFKFRNFTNGVWGNVVSGGVNQAQMQYTASDLTTLNKLAIKYKANDFALWFNGVQVLTDTSGVTPTGLKELAFDNGTGGAKFVGKTKAVAVFKEALSNDLLERLTGEGYESFRLLAEANNYTII